MNQPFSEHKAKRAPGGLAGLAPCLSQAGFLGGGLIYSKPPRQQSLGLLAVMHLQVIWEKHLMPCCAARVILVKFREHPGTFWGA